MKFLGFLVLFLLLTSTSLAATTTVSESLKVCIYEIYNPVVEERGTGFTLSDSVLGFVLVTCKHVVQDAKGDYVDSIFLRRNKLLADGETISDTSQFVVRLKIGEGFYFAKHPNPDVDLVMLPIAGWNTTLLAGESPYGLYSQVVLNKEKMDKIGIREGTDVEVVGFSFSGLLPRNRSHYHFSRFGKIGLYTTDKFTLKIDKEMKTANFVLLDMSTRKGDSGSPVFAYINENRYLIGFLSAVTPGMEYGIAYPVYYLHDLIKVMKDKFRARKAEE